MLVERITWNTYGTDHRVRAHQCIAFTCKIGLVLRNMSLKVHIEDIVTKKTLKEPKMFLLYVNKSILI